MEGLALLTASALVTLWVAWRSWLWPPFPGRRHFVGLQFAVTWWTAAVVLENQAFSPEWKVFFAKMAWLGIVAAPSFWALFVWSYIGGMRRETNRKLTWALLLIAVSIWLVGLTNDWHHLIYVEVRPLGDGPAAPLDYLHGIGFFVIAAYVYAILISLLVVILDAFHRAPALHRWHYAAMLVAMLLPWLTNASYLFGGYLVFDMEPTPFVFPVMSGIFYWLITRRQLFMLPPMARNALLDAVPDAVLVLDSDGIVVEVNRAAHSLGDLPDPIVGRSLSDAPLVAAAVQGADGDVFFATSGRYYEVRNLPLKRGDNLAGRLLVFRDITDRKLAELKLQQTLRTLERQLQNNLALQKQLRDQATRDPLTGLYNRRFFHEVQSLLLADASAMEQPLAVILIDLDEFKQVNDSHGHAAGDLVLGNLAALLLRSVRSNDYVFRMGGDEFLVLLTGVTGDQALARVEAWRQAFAADAVAVGSSVARTTFSAGVVAYPDDAGDWAQLLERADAALYRAKLAGHNRAVRWTPEL